MMTSEYRRRLQIELGFWKYKITKKESIGGVLAKQIQTKLNNLIPDKIHVAITVSIERMIKAMLFGAKYTSTTRKSYSSFQVREAYIKTIIGNYQKTASIEGAITGAGGILMGIADFPALLAIKVKMLYDIAAIYGFDTDQYKERLFMLTTFQLAFSSHHHRQAVYERILNWEAYADSLPDNIEFFDWRTFQQEYRDYIDLAKMAQLIPIVGAAIGAVVNYRLLRQLGQTTMNCYRLRILGNPDELEEKTLR